MRLGTNTGNGLINYYDITTGEKLECNGGHATKITAVLPSDGLIVDTWGIRAFVPKEELRQSGDFSIIANNYNN